jgi:peroxiredoxin
MATLKSRKGPVRKSSGARSVSAPKLILLYVVIMAVSLALTTLWLRTRHTGQGAVSTQVLGAQVHPFQLPDLVSGKTISLGDYLGKQDVVLVSYMGWFCPGCQQLLVELQGRQGDFNRRGSQLLVLGSKPESDAFVRDRIAKYGLTYPLLYDEGTLVTKQIGLWSDMMDMPWMGYFVIDKSGHIAAANFQLSEADGAGPANVNEILAAVDRLGGS